MIRVTIELVPHGIEARKRHLGTILIANDATGTLTRGNYRATLSQSGQPKRIWKSVHLTDFPRKALGAYDLLYRVLNATVSKRNAPKQDPKPQ
jgi:hypothetical protein